MKQQTIIKYLKTTLLISIFTLLNACGGGGGNNSTTISPSSAAAPTLEFNAIKNFKFAWTDVSDATFYKILENADGASGFTQVGNDIAQGTQEFSYIVPLFAKINAQYILQTCNSDGCLDSYTVSVRGSLTESVGYVKADRINADSKFGYSVALSGDGNTLAVGVRGENSGVTGVINGTAAIPASILADASGAVYVFNKNNASAQWTRQAYIKASNADAIDQFGFSVALNEDGSTLAVSAIDESSNATVINGDQNNNSGNKSGATYIFVRDASSSNWAQQAYIKAHNSDPVDNFGFSLALNGDGNTLVVGARLEDSDISGVNTPVAGNNNATNSGAAYVFLRNGVNWSQQAYIKASNTDEDDRFGHSVSISSDGNTLAIGAITEDSPTVFIDGDQGNAFADFNSGAVYLFKRNGVNWSQKTYIKASNADVNDQFGYSIALSNDGNTLAVGAINESSNALGINGDETNNLTGNSGAVYLFTQVSANWTQQAYIKPLNTGIQDQFGTSVALSENGNTLAVSSLNEDGSAVGINGQINNQAIESGAVYVFKRDTSIWSQQAYVKAPNTDASDDFGHAISLSNDGNSLAISSSKEDSSATGIGGDQNNNTTSASGAVYLY